MKRILPVIILLFYVGCTKEEPFQGRPYPKVETLEVFDSATTSTFNGEITYKPEEIIEYGFKWSRYNDPIKTASLLSISFGIPSVSTRKFSHIINRVSSSGEFWIVRAYVKSKKYTFYGEPKFFCCAR